MNSNLNTFRNKINLLDYIKIKDDKKLNKTVFKRVDFFKNYYQESIKGTFCNICYMGPCNLSDKNPYGVCGANVDIVVARNLLRQIVAGASYHAKLSYDLVLKLKQIGEKINLKTNNFNEKVLIKTAHVYEIQTENKSISEIIIELCDKFITEFNGCNDPIKTITFAPPARKKLWESINVIPKCIYKEISDALSLTHIGCEQDYAVFLAQAVKIALADGWGTSRIADIVNDILYGPIFPYKTLNNPDWLKPGFINIVTIGVEHELLNNLQKAINDSEVTDYFKQRKINNIIITNFGMENKNIFNEHNIYFIQNLLYQELLISTGAIEMVIVGDKDVLPGVINLSPDYHTKLIYQKNIDNNQKNILFLVKQAVDNYQNREKNIEHKAIKTSPLIAGFSVDSVKYILGGTFRASLRPLNDAIISGRIKGIVGIVGSNNPKNNTDQYTVELIKKLIINDILVVTTGSPADVCADNGFLVPEKAQELSGDGLKAICETVGIPPVLHFGNHFDNSRILEILCEIIIEGGLGEDICQLPVVGVAPGLMGESEITVGTYFVASGINVVLGMPANILGSQNVVKFLTETVDNLLNTVFSIFTEPDQAAEYIINIINEKREKLNISQKKERKMFDMSDRRKMT